MNFDESEKEQPQTSLSHETKSPPIWQKELAYILVFIVVWFLISVGLTSSDGGAMKSAKQSAGTQAAHAIGLGLYSYAQDHQGHYPDGKSSTEVLQQLLDGGYVTDPYIIYRAMPGKIAPSNRQLRPENVCWDVTSGADSSSPDGLPLIFLTGYKITYEAGAAAQPLTPFHGRTWSQWFSREIFWRPFIAIFYLNNTAKDITAIDDGSIPNFIPADFDPKGKTYRQLTP